jgi:hypothetical protein
MVLHGTSAAAVLTAPNCHTNQPRKVLSISQLPRACGWLAQSQSYLQSRCCQTNRTTVQAYSQAGFKLAVPTARWRLHEQILSCLLLGCLSAADLWRVGLLHGGVITIKGQIWQAIALDAAQQDAHKGTHKLTSRPQHGPHMNGMVDGNNSNQVASGEWLARHPSVNLSVNLSATDFNLNQLLVLTCQHA